MLLFSGKVEVESEITKEYEDTKERIQKIVNGKKVRILGKIIIANIFAVALFVSSLTVQACSGAESFSDEAAESEDDVFDGVILYDEQFVDETGNIYPVSLNQPRVFCFGHKIVNGYYENHLDDGNGGCTVRVYNSRRCTRCNTIWIDDLVSMHIYAKCPH